MSLTQEHSYMAANAICNAADMARESIQQAAYCYSTPSAIFRPRIFIDGNQWCALYGDDLQNGVAGFGDSPANAVHDFDRSWHAKLKEGGAA